MDFSFIPHAYINTGQIQLPIVKYFHLMAETRVAITWIWLGWRCQGPLGSKPDARRFVNNLHRPDFVI